MIEKLSTMSRELLRKMIHLSILAAVPLVHYSEWIAIFFLCLGGLVYITSEQIRLEHISPGPAVKKGPPAIAGIVQRITVFLSRSSESSDIVWAPLALSLGAVMVILMFPAPAAVVGIYCLAFGDTAALIAGQIIGGIRLPLSKEKHVSGALACWAACSIVVWVHSGSLLLSLVIGAFGAGVESLQVQNADNIMLPLTVSLLYESGMVLIG